MASLKCVRCGGEYGLMVNEPQQWFTAVEAADYHGVLAGVWDNELDDEYDEL